MLPRTMARAKTVAFVALAAGCAAPGPDAAEREQDRASTTTTTTTTVITSTVPDPGARGPNRVERQFAGPSGRKPVDLRVRPGRSVAATFVDSGSLALSIPEQRDRALAVARQLWIQIGRDESVDTVGVTFTNHADLGARKKNVEFFFYPKDFEGPR